MGFPSPAKDYTESRLSINSLCNIDANCTAIETSEGYAVINTSLGASQGRRVLIEYQGRMEFAEVKGHSLVMQDGVIKGDELDEARVIGVVTHFINRTLMDDDMPV